MEKGRKREGKTREEMKKGERDKEGERGRREFVYILTGN